ncbi:MAG TPA: hypothetical protein VJ873_09465 [bacterium]|nr:hypothetical protein [bacterium]
MEFNLGLISFGLMVINFPLMVILTFGFSVFGKKYSLKINIFYYFSISYFLVSLLSLYIQYQQPPSEYFTIPVILVPVVLSYPFGMIPFLIHIPGLVPVFGFLQWLLLAFFFQKFRNEKKPIWTVLFWLLGLSILGILLFCVFRIVFER